MRIKSPVFVLAASAILTLATASFFAHAAQPKDQPPPQQVTRAIAQVLPTPATKSQVRGFVTFTKTEKGVHVHADLVGLPPGPHGFHIHQFGDTSSPDGKAAGDHFNPRGEMHAGPGAGHRHVGDLGNIEADAQGKATYDRDDDLIQFRGRDSVLGRGVVVHEKADDLKTQPSGNAGARLGVGVIGAAKGQ